MKRLYFMLTAALLLGSSLSWAGPDSTSFAPPDVTPSPTLSSSNTGTGLQGVFSPLSNQSIQCQVKIPDPDDNYYCKLATNYGAVAADGTPSIRLVVQTAYNCNVTPYISSTIYDSGYTTNQTYLYYATYFNKERIYAKLTSSGVTIDIKRTDSSGNLLSDLYCSNPFN